MSSLAKAPYNRVLTLDPVARRVTNHVCRRFPEMKGVAPSQRPGQGPGEVVYTFRTTVSLDQGRMTYVVRVVVDERGRIVRTVTSH